MERNIFDWVVTHADLLSETAPGVTLVELAGDQRVLIENHRGVTTYGHTEIRVRVSYGMLCVCGRNLELARMTKQQLVITGCVDRVSLMKGGA